MNVDINQHQKFGQTDSGFHKLHKSVYKSAMELDQTDLIVERHRLSHVTMLHGGRH